MSADAAYQLVHDELNLDGNPSLNLASFVTSWMEPQADLLAAETLAKNLIDQDEYPQTEAVHQRVVSMIGRLFHAPRGSQSTGTATIGSSEAIMLAMLAHKRSWQLRREAAGEPSDRPNIVMGADVHTCWEKFARYFEVEARSCRWRRAATRSAPSRSSRCSTSARSASPGCSARRSPARWTTSPRSTSCSGASRPSAAGGSRCTSTPPAAASSSPFSEPDLDWDFRLAHVRSINVSNHKFGLVYPGMGTVVFRDATDLPEELVFHINYLGGDMPNYSLNFSRPSSSVVLQYFTFLRLGHEGYSEIVASVLPTAQALARELGALDALEVVNDAARFPIVSSAQTTREARPDAALAAAARAAAGSCPAYTLPPNAEHITVLRMVIKENFSRDMVDLLAHDIKAAIKVLEHGPPPRSTRESRRPLY